MRRNERRWRKMREKRNMRCSRRGGRRRMQMKNR
jgi:hypothetical protein